MGMVIRVLYNNQNWQAKCKTPGKDPFCWRSFAGGLAIRQPHADDKVCSGDCWEQRLCTEYRWGCIPKGRTFGKRAQPGTKVFLVFRQPDIRNGMKYTLWAKTTVRTVDAEPLKDGQDYEKGYAFVHFEPFEPLPKEQWVRDLSDRQLIGAPWLMGLHKYIDAAREADLERMISREPVVPPAPVGALAERVPVTPERTKWMTIVMEIPAHINDRLQEIGEKEGRTREDLVREAIAEWLSDREK